MPLLFGAAGAPDEAALKVDNPAPAAPVALSPGTRLAGAADRTRAEQASAPHAGDPLTARPDEAVSPITIKVAQAFFQGDHLKVKVHLRAETTLDPQLVAVAVTGLKEGHIVEQHVQRLSDVTTADRVRAEDTVALLFSLEEPQLTEYQVRCSWGADALSLLTENRGPKRETTVVRASLGREANAAGGAVPNEPAPASGDGLLVLSGMDVHKSREGCLREPCDVYYTVEARLENRGLRTVRGARLAVGLYWANEGQLPAVPRADDPPTPNEELIELNLALKPGEHKPLRVRLDRSVPFVPGGSFVPHLRVVSDSSSR